MCGIFGLAFVNLTDDQPSKAISKILDDLFILSQQRGQDAAGLAVFSKGDSVVDVFKEKLPPSALIKDPRYLALKENLNNRVSSSFGVIGHARMVTSGNAAEAQNNHPLQAGGLTLVHNGIVCNYKDILDKTGKLYPVNSSVDTEAFLALMRWAKDTDNASATDAMAYAYSKIEGTASIAAHAKDEEALLLATNNGSLYFSVCESSGAMLFASEQFILKSALAKNKQFQLTFGDIKKLAPNTGLRFSMKDGTRKEFHFKYSHKRGQRNNVCFDKRAVIHAIKSEDFLEYDEDLILSLPRCSKCLLPVTYPFIEFDHKGVCNFCHHMKPTVVEGQDELALRQLLEQFARQHPGSDNCVIPLSGGRDSCFGTYTLVKDYGVRPITYTYDWGMVTDLARRNVARACGALGIENILVSANISKKLDYIRRNISAWLKSPDLGLIPLFMAGDKQFFSWVNKIKKQNGLDLNVWMMSPLENADFKEGFSGVKPHWERERTDFLTARAKLRMLSYYGGSFIKNPRYLNRSLLDTAGGFFAFYHEPRNDYHNLFDFMAWDEQKVHDVIFDELGWENSPDSPNTWRVGDGTAPFYNYIYTTVAGFSENDTFRSNQIRNGDISREQGLKLVVEENIPRREGLIWYLDRVGLPYRETIKCINEIPKLY